MLKCTIFKNVLPRVDKTWIIPIFDIEKEVFWKKCFYIKFKISGECPWWISFHANREDICFSFCQFSWKKMVFEPVKNLFKWYFHLRSQYAVPGRTGEDPRRRPLRSVSVRDGAGFWSIQEKRSKCENYAASWTNSWNANESRDIVMRTWRGFLQGFRPGVCPGRRLGIFQGVHSPSWVIFKRRSTNCDV